MNREEEAMWQALAEGTASPDEIRHLQQRAALDPDAATAWERFRPLEDDDDLRIASAMARRVRSDRRRSRFTAAAGALAAVLVAGVWFASPNGNAGLPSYGLEASTPDLQMRGTEAEGLPRHAPGSVLTLVLRPADPVQEPVTVDSYLVEGDGLVTLNLRWDTSRQGSARLSGEVRALFGARSGPQRLLALVRADRTERPSTQSVLHALGNTITPLKGVQILDYHFLLAEAP